MFGDSLSLECQLDARYAKFLRVTWIPPKNSDCPQTPRNGKTISVTDVSRCDSGVWTCKVEYDQKEAEATTIVSVIGESP